MTAPTPATDQRQRRIGAALLIAIVGLLLGLIGRLVYIQTSLRADLLAKAQRQQRGDSVLPARRGRILDSRGRVVAATQVKPDVFVDPSGSITHTLLEWTAFCTAFFT
ncbi:MAG: hypothetical protein IIB60_04995, partial [Planctomycetes bacterium]|nr:hypothetical protein [Planctomycetota bacterium]